MNATGTLKAAAGNQDNDAVRVDGKGGIVQKSMNSSSSSSSSIKSAMPSRRKRWRGQEQGQGLTSRILLDVRRQEVLAQLQGKFLPA